MNSPYEIIHGVGRLYVAPYGTTFPAVNETPADPWHDLGETYDGITVTLDQEIQEATVDQETGPVDAWRTEESLGVETNLALGTLENFAFVIDNTVAQTKASVGVIGTREVPLYKGSTVKKCALLFRGEHQSPYGDYPAQFQVPYGYFEGAAELEYTKDGQVTIQARFRALVDPAASTADDKFGKLIVQDADAVAP